MTPQIGVQDKKAQAVVDKERRSAALAVEKAGLVGAGSFYLVLGLPGPLSLSRLPGLFDLPNLVL